MPVLTLDQFLLAFPELDAPSPLLTEAPEQAASILARISQAEGEIKTSVNFYGTDPVELGDSDTFVTNTQYAQLLLAAHKYIGRRPGNRHGAYAVGQLTSRTSQTNQTRGYSSIQFEDPQYKVWSTTTYGMDLIGMDRAQAACLMGFVAV